eukprot:Hpha_TRINITY_DN24504_c0_g1::TRINITY_DN24504_c0_g1_i1::g.172557::m.172557
MSRLLFSCLVVGAAGASFPSSIAVGQNASAVSKFAAGELRTLLQALCPGKNFTIDPPSVERVQLVAGPEAAVQVGVPPADLEGLGNETYILDTLGGHSIPPGSVLLTGGVNSARGSLYAVYALMD